MTVGHLTEPAVIFMLVSVVRVPRLLAGPHWSAVVGVLAFLAALALEPPHEVVTDHAAAAEHD